MENKYCKTNVMVRCTDDTRTCTTDHLVITGWNRFKSELACGGKPSSISLGTRNALEFQEDMSPKHEQGGWPQMYGDRFQ